MFKKKRECSNDNTRCILKTAAERYAEAEKPQIDKYIRKIEERTEAGEEYCYLMTDSMYPMRPEHIKMLTDKGYDLDINRHAGILSDTRFSYWAKCFWTKDSSGKVNANYDWDI